MGNLTLEKSVIEDWLHRCISCSNCKYVFREYGPACPSGEKYRFETYFASGRLRIAQGITKGELEWDETLMDPLFACTTCGSCEIQCLSPHREHIVDIIEEIRYQAVKALGALPKHKQFADKIREKNNPYDAEHHNRQMVDIHNLPREASLVYFIGCTSNYRETSIRDATISLLKKAGLEFTIVDEHCCGSPLLRTGQREMVRDLAKHNSVAFQESGAKRIVTSCAGCFRTLDRDYPNIGVELGVEVVHITQLLQELISEGRLTIDQTSPILKVTYHDPCHLGRHMGVYDEPREVLIHLPVELVEMNSNRENAWCCGAGGGARAAYADWSLETSERRIKEAEATGAKVVVSGCPFCTKNLRDASESSGLAILDITELVEKHLQKFTSE